MTRKWIQILFVCAVALGVADASYGLSSYAVAFSNAYPSSPLSGLSQVSGQPSNLCSVCHGVSAPPLNSFGGNYSTNWTVAGAGTHVGHTFDAALNAIDSDGDGSTNLAEITYGTRPGDAASMPGLWAGAQDLGGGWRWLSWFGYFNDAGNGWIYHNEHHWMYTTSLTTGSIWFYTADLGWLWTSSTTYSYLYRDSDGVWLWYQLNSASPRWFYNFTTSLWESHP